MGLAETAQLLVNLTLKDNLSKGMQEFQETGGRNVPALCS